VKTPKTTTPIKVYLTKRQTAFLQVLMRDHMNSEDASVRRDAENIMRKLTPRTSEQADCGARHV